MLSDACFEFSHALEQGETGSKHAEILKEQIVHYSTWGYPPKVMELLTKITDAALASNQYDKVDSACKLTTKFYDTLPELVVTADLIRDLTALA